MTVEDLIKTLQDMPQNLEVYINAYCEEKEAEEVAIVSEYGVGFECVEIS